MFDLLGWALVTMPGVFNSYSCLHSLTSFSLYPCSFPICTSSRTFSLDMSSSDSDRGFFSPRVDDWPDESEILETPPPVRWPKRVLEASVESDGSSKDSGGIESEILESLPSVQPSEPVREISVVSISSSRSSDIIEVPASGVVATSITEYATVDGRSVTLLECLRHYFPSALLNADLRSSSLGTEEMCLHCVLRVAFDDPVTLHNQKPFCNPGSETSCGFCTDLGLACFRIPPLGSRELASDMLRRTRTSNSAFSHEHWRLVCRTIAETVGVSEQALRQAMLWDNRYLRAGERSATRPE